MLMTIRGSLIILALATAVPAFFQGELLAGRRDGCCRKCQHPGGKCVCPTAAVQAVPPAAYQPVYETQYAQQPVLQEREVLATEYRTEPINESVPTTVYENVMVDEGSYQTVWVPRVTNRAVARTVYQTRTSYRTVPYQVSRRVSEYATQTVPYQTVRYVPMTAPAYAYMAPPTTVAAYPWTSPIAAAPILSSPAPVISSAPYATSPYLSNATGLVPDARYANTPASPITPRTASSSNRSGGYESGTSDTRSADRGPSLFSPAPSAAQVWRTPRNSAVR